MRQRCIPVLMVLFVRCSSAAEPTIVSATPIPLTRASCSGPRGKATLTVATNPFAAGQWIAVRDVPSSAPIVVTGKKVAVGDGSLGTYTFRTTNYPIRLMHNDPGNYHPKKRDEVIGKWRRGR